MDRDRLKLDTPEGLALDLILAGPGTRAIAAMFDGFLQALALVALWLIVANGSGEGLLVVFIMIVSALFVPGYYVFFEMRSSGQTPGKKRMKLRVLSHDGGPVTLGASLARNLLRLVDFLPSSYFVGAIAMFMSSRNQRLGDMAAGTIVVIESQPKPPTALDTAPPPQLRPHDGATWDVTAVTAEEVVLIRAFLARRSSLPNDVRAKLGHQLADRVRPRVVAPGARPTAEQLLEGILRHKWEGS